MAEPRPSLFENATATSWAPVAIAGGAVWALPSLRDAVSLREYYALTCGGALSLWLVLVACSELAKHRRLLAAILPSLGLSLLVLTLGGRWLIDATHHRPLGAVTFSFAACTVFGAAFAIFWQRTIPLLWGALLAACSIAWVGAVLLPLGERLLEPLFGIGLAVVMSLLGKRVRVKSRGLAVGCAASLASACVVAMWLAPGVAAHPVVLGLPGLVR